MVRKVHNEPSDIGCGGVGGRGLALDAGTDYQICIIRAQLVGRKSSSQSFSNDSGGRRAASLFLYVQQAGFRWEFDPRELDKNHERYTFNNQVLDNMFWTLLSGVTFWSASEAVFLWSYANGAIPLLIWSDSPVWFVLLFPLIALWHELYFYFVHRLLHWPPLYRIAHSVHHRNTDTGPWSGISMHPVEHAIYFASLVIHLVLPTHPMHLVFHLYWLALGPAISHSGYQGVSFNGKLLWATGSFFHQLHHRYFECNYATSNVPVDALVGSFHDGTRESDAYIRERRKRHHRGQ